MPRFLIAIMMISLAGSTALAERTPVPVDSLEAPIMPGVDARDGAALLFEDFESGFTTGNAPQNGWSGEFNSSFFFTNVDPISGEFSARHTSDGTGFTGLEMASPVITPGYGAVASDVRLSGSNSLYQFVTISNTTGFFNTRINFETDGRITVGQVNMAMTGFDFIDTGETWSVGDTFNIGIGVEDSGRLDVFLDGEIVFTGLDTNFVINGVAGQIDQWAAWVENTGVGTPGGVGDTMTVDNFGKPIPAPGALALFGLAGLGAVRRRR